MLSADKRRLLRRVWLFESLDDADLDLILSCARESACEGGQLLIMQGDTSGDLFAVIDGRLKVTATLNEEEVLLSIVGPRDVFGEVALLDGAERSASVTALERCRLLVIPRAAFRSLLLSIPALGVRLLESLAQRVRTLTSRAEDGALLDVPTRLAKAALALAARFGIPAGQRRTRLSLKLSQQALGNLVGATREMVNKCLRRWARNRVVLHRNGVLTILNDQRLRAAAEGKAIGRPSSRGRARGLAPPRRKARHGKVVRD